jgi:chromosome segregation protein
MIIKKLELQGFKSFSERKKIIFHPGITAVVGPNGTGKSNIVDAILWVLGGKRFKSLRGERSKDIIFNGNTKIAPVSMADVSLFLGDEDEELVISHRVFRSGESEYRMNGKSVRLKDIQESLWKKSIGETEYFVIEQGSIGLFLSSKPTEKRLLLEEAAGTAYYKDKKRQTQNKLESSELNLTRLEDIISEVSTAKNSLKRQAHAAIRYRKLREKIRELTLLYYKEKIEKLEKSHKEASNAFNKGLYKEKETSSKLKEEEKNLAEKQKQTWDLEEGSKKGHETLYSMRAQLSRLETENDKETKTIELTKEKKEAAQRNKEDLQQELSALKGENTKFEQSLANIQVSLEGKKKEIESSDKKILDSKDSVEKRKQKIADLRNDSLQKISTLTEVRNDAAKIEKEIEIHKRQKDKLEAQLVGEKVLFQEKQTEMQQREKEVKKTQVLLEKKQEDVVSSQTKLEEIEKDLESHQDRLTELKHNKDKETHHLHALEKLEEREQPKDISTDLPEAMGVLADLIESDREHAFLVDVFWKKEAKGTIINAADFLSRLKEKDLKGDFILLHAQKKDKQVPKAYKDPRVLGLLKARVQPSSKIKDYFDQFDEAAIVKDIETAVEMWLQFPGLNYITSQGDLLLHSGFLTLGAKKEGLFYIKQEMKSLKERIAILEKEISTILPEVNLNVKLKNELEEQIQNEREAAAKLERTVAGREKEKGYDQSDKEKIEMRIFLIEKEITVLSDEEKTLSQKMTARAERIQEVEEERLKIKESLQKEEEDLSKEQEKSEQRRKQFFETKSTYDIQAEKAKNLEQQIQETQRREKSIDAKIKNLEKEVIGCDRKEEESKKTIASIKTKTTKLEEDRNATESQLAADEIQLREIQEGHEKLEIKVKELREASESCKDERMQKEISKAEVERDLINLEESCWQELKKTIKEVKKEDTPEVETGIFTEEALAEAKDSLQKFKAVNLMAEEEYEIQKERHEFLTKQKEDLRESIDSTKEAIKKIDKESKTQFMKALEEVNKYFKEVFALLFKGGNAEVKLTDPNQPLESGVEIVAQPPEKKLQSLNLLSGGEKSLTSLAFFFALFHYKPIPFCILDEVDAALDDANLMRFLDLMKKIKIQTQFILITHNFKSMEVADYIYGTTMGEPNITNIYSVKLEKKESPEKNSGTVS